MAIIRREVKKMAGQNVFDSAAEIVEQVYTCTYTSDFLIAIASD